MAETQGIDEQAAAGTGALAGVTVTRIANGDGTYATCLDVNNKGAGGTGGGGDASAANQTTEIAKLTSIDGKTPALGATTAAASSPVAIATDQFSTLATAVKQDTGNTSLGSIDGKLPTAAAPADATALGTLTRLGALLFGYNGTTADLLRSGFTGVKTTVLGYLNTLPQLRYEASPGALADGNWAGLRGDAAGNLKTTLNTALDSVNDSIAVKPKTPTSSASTAREKTHVIQASPGVLSRVSVTNSAAATAYFLQLFDRTTAPVSGTTVPVTNGIPIAASSYKDQPYPHGRAFGTGIVVAISTTQDVYTAPAANDGWFDWDIIPAT